ncbi:hypothetical protein NDU88_004204 [Pleurodeles waltl]|uniref:Uncharacterized protein n=1 Tax=Pleurodeles waltl TaxID=8319 RepID=A0AAV7L808_PLEWA|nr:hypothetical protein NDU88_004204 [Pleurodeles waltl]
MGVSWDWAPPFTRGADERRQPVRLPQEGAPRRPSEPLQSLLSSCGRPGPPPQGLDPLRSGAGSARAPLTCPALLTPRHWQPPPQLQGCFGPRRQLRGEGRVQGHPPLRYSSLPRPQGPAPLRGLRLSSSSDALLYPRPELKGTSRSPWQPRSEGRVRGRPPARHSPPRQPLGPTAIRGLCQSSSSSAPLCPRHDALQGRSSITAPTGPAPRQVRHPRSERINPLGPREGCFSRISLQALTELRVYASDIVPGSATPPK